jgi:DNA-directed RNA polymerase specialized sigma24 family protein
VKNSILRLTPRQWASIPDAVPTPPAPWRWLSHEDLDEAISLLDPPFATAIRMFLQGTPVAEMARRMNVPTGTTIARILRGRGRLRRILEAKLPTHVREHAPVRRW